MFGLARMFHEFESFFCKAFRGAVVLLLTQVPDNEANGQLGLVGSYRRKHTKSAII